MSTVTEKLKNYLKNQGRDLDTDIWLSLNKIAWNPPGGPAGYWATSRCAGLPSAFASLWQVNGRPRIPNSRQI